MLKLKFIKLKMLNTTLSTFLQNEWRHSGEFCQNLWIRLLLHLNADEFQLYVYGNGIFCNVIYLSINQVAILCVPMLTGTVILSWIYYQSVGLIFTLVDVFKKPTCAYKYKIEHRANKTLDLQRLAAVIMRI